MVWLQAVADRAACGLMVLEGSTLFSEEGSKMVSKHFSAVLDGLASGQDEGEEEDALEPASGEEDAAVGT